MTNKTILVAEDDENDITFLKIAIQKVGLTNPVQFVTDGRAVLDYFGGNGKYADRSEFPLPCLMLLDLKLPYVMGLDVLGWIRTRPAFSSTIIIVLTSSRHTKDIEAAYRLGANAFLVKPADIDAFVGMLKTLKDFWLTQNTPPPDYDKGAADELPKVNP